MQYIWPDASEEYAWPEKLQRKPTIENFIVFYQMCGFCKADNFLLETGWEKIAIFEDMGEVAHAARQLEDGSWVSRIGDLVDVIHYDLDAVSGGANGLPCAVVKRVRTNFPPKLPQMHPPLTNLVNSSGTPLSKLIMT